MGLKNLEDAPEKLKTLVKRISKRDVNEHDNIHIFIEHEEDMTRWANEIESLLKRSMLDGGVKCPSCGTKNTVRVVATSDVYEKMNKDHVDYYHCCCICRNIFIDK